MNVIIGCEHSQVICKAFRDRGHNAWSCDLKDCSGPLPQYHYKEDVFKVIGGGYWDLLIGHPPCTFNANSSAQWRWHPEDKNLPKQLRRPHPLYPNRKQDQQDAIDFFKKMWTCNVKKKCLENPMPLKSLILQVANYTQIIQPWQFGDSFQKTTHLWLQGLPRLKPTNIVDKGEFIITSGGKKMPKWYNDAKTGSKEKTQEARSITFPGIANAMSEQWGIL